MRRAWSLVLLVVLVLAAVGAETLAERQAREASVNPPGLHCKLATRDGRRVFHRGEEIVLRLSYTSDTPGRYVVETASYDRSGRLPNDHWVIEPSVADPYADYFNSGMMGGIGGGPRGNSKVGTEPVSIDLALNDRFRFDRSGVYRFYLRSRRLAPASAQIFVQPSLDSVSNFVEIEIDDDAAWLAAREQTLCAAAAALIVQPVRGANDPDVRWPTARPYAVTVEARRLGTPRAIECGLEADARTAWPVDGLMVIAARDRAAAIAVLDRHLARPEIAIYDQDLRLRALLDFVAAPERTGESHVDRVHRLECAAAVRLFDAVRLKQGMARRVSVQALTAVAGAEMRAAGLAEPPNYGMTRAELIAHFASLDRDRQREILQLRWSLVSGPEMIDVLKTVIAASAPEPLRPGLDVMAQFQRVQGLARLAFDRLSQLSTRAALDVGIADLATAQPRLDGFVSIDVPSQSLPQLDAAFGAMLDREYDLAVPLVARFGSPALAPLVRAHLAAGPPACRMEQPEAVYFARIAPEPNGEGERVMRAARRPNGYCGWYRTLVSTVAKTIWNTAVERIALEALDDREPDAVADAATSLAAHGGSEVEAALWRRMERWSGSRGEARPAREPLQEVQLGRRLAQSLAHAQGWIYDAPRRDRLMALCPDDECRRQWGRCAGEAKVQLQVRGAVGFDAARFSVDGIVWDKWDGFVARLGQYPSGTHMTWFHSRPGEPSPELAVRIAQLKIELAARGIQLEAGVSQ